MGRHSMDAGNDNEEPRVVVRDRRKIDPETGELRQEPVEVEGVPEVPVSAAGPEAGESTLDESVVPAGDVERQLAERTADLQRIQAEYANYRKRVEREREAAAATAKASVVGDLLPLLDDLERAEAHGDLTGAFKAVADKLVNTLQRAGLESFGTEGEPFDPSVHEAVQHATSPEVDGPTVTTVLRRGYHFGDRVLRAALVGVTDHEPAAEPAAAEAEVPVDPPVEGELPLNTDENAR
ncbi:nucleotide exchange factor GrpE [Amycolatopsis cihanbeyliensis]|uniref:Protein GrpE n=1 Tax=Amycolatopsis cihanbeyliensis TaxID=1128664 RepID=A0A542DKU9_AMYCI|nr:nucleotide exchange factor GrpE [Amycolatopsis cihanbeyliensis]TQJ03654.1 molecular chaperone GrpE [Amycolatopsis cihanbeyliensis]